MGPAGRMGPVGRAESVTLSPRGGSDWLNHATVSCGGRAFRGGTCPLRTATSFAPVRPNPSNGRPSRRRYEPCERRSDYGCPKCGQALHPLARARAPVGAARPLRRRRELPRLAVTRACDSDRLQRRAPLREALAGDRGGPPVLASRRALLLPLDPRATRPVARVAPRLDDGRLHGRQADQRGADVSGGLPRVLARRAASCVRPTHCSPQRRRWRRRRSSTTATSCPRRSPIPSSSLRSPSSRTPCKHLRAG